jgi:hypothetical protein
LRKGDITRALSAGLPAKERESAYELARVKALALLDPPSRLGGAKVVSRDELHERQRKGSGDV